MAPSVAFQGAVSSTQVVSLTPSSKQYQAPCKQLLSEVAGNQPDSTCGMTGSPSPAQVGSAGVGAGGGTGSVAAGGGGGVGTGGCGVVGVALGAISVGTVGPVAGGT